MKCLENYTIECVKKMSYEELMILWNKVVREKQETDIRHTIVSMLEIMEAEKK